jgi:hypothetical protein
MQEEAPATLTVRTSVPLVPPEQGSGQSFQRLHHYADGGPLHLEPVLSRALVRHAEDGSHTQAVH